MVDVRAKEKLRKFFKPRRVKLLFVGESVPVGGNQFHSTASHFPIVADRTRPTTKSSFQTCFANSSGTG